MIIGTFYIISIINILHLYCRGTAILLPYSRKYWRELNLVVEPKITNLAVRYRIAIRIYVSRKFWQILIWRL